MPEVWGGGDRFEKALVRAKGLVERLDMKCDKEGFLGYLLVSVDQDHKFRFHIEDP